MSDSNQNFTMGWFPDYPDFRDYGADHAEIKPMVKKLNLAGPLTASLPASVDLRPWCSEIENQGGIGSCTAQAGVGLLEYYEKRAFGRHIDASRLFLYKATRNLLHWTGDTGAFLRSTMAAMVLFGICPEEYWSYTDQVPDFDKEPPAFCYSFAQSYQAIKYLRLDPPATPKDLLLKRVKYYLAAKLPSMFGFTVFSSYTQANNDGKIPYPCRGERIVGGHAIVAVGYDDKMKIKNTVCGVETKGALLIRNSWGTGWGDKGYGWLPYEYVLKGLAVDWWTLLNAEWVNTKKFGL